METGQQGYSNQGYGAYGASDQEQPAYNPGVPYGYDSREPPPPYNPGAYAGGQLTHDTVPSYGGTEQSPFTLDSDRGDDGGTVAETGGFTTAEKFSDKQVRRTFIKKVYITLTIQLLVTFGIVCVFTFVDEVKEWVQSNPGFYYASYGVFIFVYLVIACVESLRRKSPHNLVMMTILTLSLSYMTGTIASFYDSRAVIVCIAITLGVCIGVTLFCIQTRFDFTALIGIAFVLTLAVLFFAIIAIFTRNNIMDTVIGLICALLLVLWLAIDTQLICGGKKHELSPEEYIFAALCLYIDIVYLFLIILSILGKSQ